MCGCQLYIQFPWQKWNAAARMSMWKHKHTHSPVNGILAELLQLNVHFEIQWWWFPHGGKEEWKKTAAVPPKGILGFQIPFFFFLLLSLFLISFLANEWKLSLKSNSIHLPLLRGFQHYQECSIENNKLQQQQNHTLLNCRRHIYLYTYTHIQYYSKKKTFFFNYFHLNRFQHNLVSISTRYG